MDGAHDFHEGDEMSFGWVDPDSVRAEDDKVIGDFHNAATGKMLILRLPNSRISDLDRMLETQARLGVVFLSPNAPGLNTAESYTGTIVPDSRTGGQATLSTGEKIEAEFPTGAFEDEVPHRFRATGDNDGSLLTVFAAEVRAAPELANTPEF